MKMLSWQTLVHSTKYHFVLKNTCCSRCNAKMYHFPIVAYDCKKNPGTHFNKSVIFSTLESQGWVVRECVCVCPVTGLCLHSTHPICLKKPLHLLLVNPLKSLSVQLTAPSDHDPPLYLSYTQPFPLHPRKHTHTRQTDDNAEVGKK